MRTIPHLKILAARKWSQKKGYNLNCDLNLNRNLVLLINTPYFCQASEKGAILVIYKILGDVGEWLKPPVC